MKYIIHEQQINRAVMNWLDKDFSNLIKSEEDFGVVDFHSKDDNECAVVMYYTGTKIAYFNSQKIWIPLTIFFSLEMKHAQKILRDWFFKNYNIDLIGVGRFACK